MVKATEYMYQKNENRDWHIISLFQAKDIYAFYQCLLNKLYNDENCRYNNPRHVCTWYGLRSKQNLNYK